MGELLTWIAYAGTAVFAVSGALQGLRHRMDIIGVAFLATLTGIGGGTVRDVLLSAGPPRWVTEPTDLIICIGCAFLVALGNNRLTGHRLKWLIYADAVGLALFSVLGTAKAMEVGAHPLVAILFGAMSAAFGGIIRDVVCLQKPILFNKEVYITAALVAGACFLLGRTALSLEASAFAATIMATALRIAAVERGWSLAFPVYADPVPNSLNHERES